jgi:hypothetical protein
MEFWSDGVMEFWSFGVLEFWSFGVLEFWSFGVLEFWSFGRAKKNTLESQARREISSTEETRVSNSYLSNNNAERPTNRAQPPIL